jgi:beta-glucosidase
MAEESGVKFPEGFLWGAATSSHQIEGSNRNDWSAWEDAGHAKGAKSGPAVEEWSRYKHDFSYLSKMSLNAYRFSVEWSRIEPREAQFDQAAIARYRDMLLELKKRKVTPMVTLHHFTLPLWVARDGGWGASSTPEKFAWYCEKVVEQLGPEVSMWLTINEPTIVGALGYLVGSFPPGHKRDLLGFRRAYRNQLMGHQLAYKRIHALYAREGWGKVQVSFANQQEWVEPRNPSSPLDRLAAWLQRRATNNYFVARTRATTDFLAVNYYFPNRVYFQLGGKYGIAGHADIPGARVSDTGWTVAPEGLKHVCLSLKEQGKPVYITENGLADAEDKVRAWAIVGAARAIGEARAAGVDVRGYFHWSLTDTFEWEWGYGPRFGLVAVDFQTQERQLRPSGKVYAQIAESNRLELHLAEKYK